ncbi:MAG: serine/threonine protein kinase [Gammaproteobacteria bacterium]
MIYQKHCPGCFVNKSGLAVCPHCGYDESAPRSALYLPHGIVVGGQFRIGRVLGQPGGFGITYLAWDVHLQQRVAVKEYLPKALADRAGQSQDVRVLAAEQEPRFREGLEHFLHEARVIARLDHPNVVRVRSFFRANGTAYLVMDYYDGISLGDYLTGLPGGRVDPQTAVRLLGPVLDGLQFVHERGVVHRDIKPHNVYLASGGRAILLDFGAAHQHAAEGGKAVMLSEGYAPLEQYQRDAEQGPATDVYGVAATLYRMVLGAAPPAALDRMGDDPIEKPLALDPPGFLAVLRKGLALRAHERYASAAEFQQALFRALDIADSDATPTRAGVQVRRAQEPDTREYGAADLPTAPRGVPPSPATAPEPASLRGATLIAAAILLGAAMIAATLWIRLP